MIKGTKISILYISPVSINHWKEKQNKQRNVFLFYPGLALTLDYKCIHPHLLFPCYYLSFLLHVANRNIVWNLTCNSEHYICPQIYFKHVMCDPSCWLASFVSLSHWMCIVPCVISTHRLSGVIWSQTLSPHTLAGWLGGGSLEVHCSGLASCPCLTRPASVSVSAPLDSPP